MAVTREQVAEIYVATFDRAPDAAGLEYWVNNSGLTIEGIAQSFFDQPETQEEYPEATSDADFVNTIYQNLFNRIAEPDGLIYWVNELEAGNISRGNMILAIVNGAQNTPLGPDDTILANKTEVGLDFANAGLNNITNATDVMANVDETQASVDAALAQIDIWQTIHDTRYYTLGVDPFEGTNGNDIFSGILDNRTSEDLSTFQTADSTDGKAGYDTVDIVNVSTNTVNIAVDMTSIEEFHSEESNTASTTYGMQNVSGLEKIVMEDFSDSAVTFNNLANIVDVDMQSNTNITAFTVEFAGGAVSSGSDVMNLSVTSYDQLMDTFTTNGIETINLTVTGDNHLRIVDTALESVIIDGSGDLIYDMATGGNTSPLVIDGSGITGNLETTGSYATRVDVTGGDGNDTLRGTANNDILEGGAGIDELYGLVGSDIFVFNTGDSALVEADADIIHDFNNMADSIRLGTAGTAGNYGEDITGILSFNDALDAANSSGKDYYFADDGLNGYLFANTDGSAGMDIAILLDNVTWGTFDFTDIIV